MAVLQGFDCDVLITANPSLVITNEAATDSGNKIIYTMSVHKYWDKSKPFTVQCSPNGSTGWVTVVDYKMQWVGGVITFNTARVAGTNNFVQVSSGFYFIASQSGDASAWSMDISANVVDVTPFQSPWKQYITTSKNASAKVSSYKPDDAFSKDLGNMMILILYLDKSIGSRYEMYGWITKAIPKSDATGIVQQEADFTVEGDVFFLPA